MSLTEEVPQQARTDAALVAEARSIGGEAENALFQRYYPYVLTIALRFAKGRIHDAEDIAQTVFLNAHMNLNGFRGDSEVKTWLYRIAHNVFVGRLRKRQELSGLDPETYDMLLGGAKEGLPTPFDTWNMERVRMAVRLVFDGLSSEHRSVLALRYAEDMQYDEIADALDIPIGTVRSRLNRARRVVRDSVQELAAKYDLPLRVGDGHSSFKGGLDGSPTPEGFDRKKWRRVEKFTDLLRRGTKTTA